MSHADGSMIFDENDDIPYVRLLSWGKLVKMLEEPEEVARDNCLPDRLF